MRVILVLTLTVLVLSGTSSAADTVVSYDGTRITGALVRLKDGGLEIQPKGKEKPSRIALSDVWTVRLVPTRSGPKKQKPILVVDNDGFHAPVEKSGTIKLRKGLHTFTLMYFNSREGAVLELEVEGPGVERQKVPESVLFKWKTSLDEVTFSPGLDDEGFRKPDKLEVTESQVGYQLYEWPQESLVGKVGDLPDREIKKSGTLRELDLDFPHQPTHFGVVYYGLMEAPADGEYTFHLNSDDGSQFYIGKTPAIPKKTRAPKKDEWLVRLNDGGRLDLPLLSWDEQAVTFAYVLKEQEIELAIPLSHLREVWSREYADKQASVDRSDEPDDADTVYAKNADGQVQQVTGKIMRVEDKSLKFEFQGKERSIGLERIIAVVMRKSRPSPIETTDQPRRIRLRFDLVGDNEFVGELLEFSSGRAVIKLPWGQKIAIRRNVIEKMYVLNGRMQSLQELTPVDIVQTPFFDRILTWRSGQSLGGGKLKIGAKIYEKGLCLHSRTRLTYDLAGEYDRFLCDIGLQRPDGDAGNATVRIIADGTELFVAEEVTAEDEPQSLDLDLTGKTTLTLEVDFGRNMHIGDHVVFGNPRLLRPEPAP